MTSQIVTAAVLLVAVAAIAGWAAHWRSTRAAVEQHSAAILEVVALNHAFAAKVIDQGAIEYVFAESVDSKPRFDRFDVNGFLRRCLEEREAALAQRILAWQTARRHFADYERRCTSIAAGRLGRSSLPNLDQSRFNDIEARLFHRRKMKQPTCRVRVQCVVGYTSPQGRNSYQRGVSINSLEELAAALDEMRQVRTHSSHAVSQRNAERSKMTARMRVDVIRRDGHRCRFCGATQAVAQLEVDHIVPVSRGGKTEMSNLQTLCADCNRGKSNRFSG